MCKSPEKYFMLLTSNILSTVHAQLQQHFVTVHAQLCCVACQSRRPPNFLLEPDHLRGASRNGKIAFGGGIYKKKSAARQTILIRRESCRDPCLERSGCNDVSVWGTDVSVGKNTRMKGSGWGTQGLKPMAACLFSCRRFDAKGGVMVYRVQPT